ncbi:SLC13 family permease [Streptomyces sp. NPDC015139]|uniref:GntT/GntP/DsdX family permease n=1 Tax=Streptomyces sp. NPDC015139 TaxID=3364942 RepID=UPI0036FDB1C6
MASRSGPAAVAAASWSAHDTWLMIVVGLSVVLVVVLVSWAKLHAFLALTLGAFAVTVLSGQGVARAAAAFTTGFGATAGQVGVLIVLGAVFGRLLADSGGVDQLVSALTRRVGPKRLPWAVTGIACLVGLPMFFEVGFVMLVPLVLQIARRAGQPVLRIGVPAVVGLATVHALVPPHPGVLAAITAVHADTGLTLLYGLVIAIPCAVVAGPLFTAYIWPRVAAHVPEAALAAFTADAPAPAAVPLRRVVRLRAPAVAPVPAAASPVPVAAAGGPPASAAVGPCPAAPAAPAGPPERTAREPRAEDRTAPGGGRRTPPFAVTLCTVLLPVVLMMLEAASGTFHLGHGFVARAIAFTGTPVVALLLAVLVALAVFGWAAGASRRRVHETLTRAFPPIAGVLVIVCAGGGYSAALRGAGIDTVIGEAARDLHIPLILLAWLVAALMRAATGSGTVATVAAGGIVASMAHGLNAPHAALLALALGSGAVFLGHVNDASFWMFKEYFGLSVGGTLRTWTVSHMLISLLSLGGILLLNAFAA